MKVGISESKRYSKWIGRRYWGGLINGVGIGFFYWFFYCVTNWLEAIL